MDFSTLVVMPFSLRSGAPRSRTARGYPPPAPGRPQVMANTTPNTPELSETGLRELKVTS